MLVKPLKTSLSNPSETRELSYPSLAHRSLELYDFLKDKYLELDRCWGEDMDIIREEATKSSNGCHVLDAGCGPGWHTMQCSQLDSVEQIHGLDFSTGMIAAAQNRANRAPSKKQIEFHVHDLLQPLENFGLFDLIICMNNVLGNVLSQDINTAESDRRRFLDNIRLHLNTSGRLILSVYMRTYMPQDCAHGKDKGFRLLNGSNICNGELIVGYKPVAESNFCYYSHWFTEKELTNLLSESGFEILYTVDRPPRLIVVACANGYAHNHINNQSKEMEEFHSH